MRMENGGISGTHSSSCAIRVAFARNRAQTEKTKTYNDDVSRGLFREVHLEL